MNRNPRNYNGLHLPASAIPPAGNSQMQIGLAQQLGVISREIYVRAVSEVMLHTDGHAGPETYRALAKDSHIAAKAYFEAFGVQFEEPPQPSSGE